MRYNTRTPYALSTLSATLDFMKIEVLTVGTGIIHCWCNRGISSKALFSLKWGSSNSNITLQIKTPSSRGSMPVIVTSPSSCETVKVYGSSRSSISIEIPSFTGAAPLAKANNSTTYDTGPVYLLVVRSVVYRFRSTAFPSCS